MNKKQNFLLVASLETTVVKLRGNLMKELSKHYNVLVSCPKPNQTILDELKDLNVKLIQTSLKKDRITPFYDLFYLLQLIWILFKFKPVKVLAYTQKPIFFSGLASKFFKTDLYALVTGLGTFFELNGHSLIKDLVIRTYSFSLSRAKKVFFYNEANKKYFLNNGISKEKQSIMINGSGVDIKHYKSKNLNKKNKKVLFLCVARFLKDKGIIEYLESAKNVLKESKDAEFHLIGWEQNSRNSISKDKIERICNDYGIILHDYAADIRLIIDACDVFVLPSYHEGLPRSALEAMSMSKAMLLSNIPGCSNLIDPSKNGFYFEPKSARSLTKAVHQILENKDKLSLYGSYSRTLVKKYYSDKIINSYLLRFMDILNSNVH